MDYINLKDSHLDLSNIRKVSKKLEDTIRFRSKDFIPITNDSMFKVLFGREDNIKFPCKLLSYIIDISYEELLKCLRFTKTETGKKKKEDSGYRNDLVVDVNGSVINIEMNNNSTEDIRNRNISYLMRLREDKKNRSQYHQVIQVNLNNYCYHNDNKIRRNFTFIDEDGVILTNKILIIDIYLPNIKKKMYNEGIDMLSEMERFLLIGIEEDKHKALEYVGEDIVMREFEERITEWTLSEDLRESYDKEWAIKDQAHREGIEQGIEQGLEQKELELINNLLDSELSIEEIAKLTKLPKERILEIKEMN